MGNDNGWFQIESNAKVSSNGKENKRDSMNKPEERMNPAPSGTMKPRPPMRPVTPPNKPPNKPNMQQRPPQPPPKRPQPQQRGAVVTGQITGEAPIKVGTRDPYQDERKTKHSETVGPRGPVLVQDQVVHEELETFVNSPIPARIVHTKGWSAFGNFRTYKSMREYTKLNFLQNPGETVPVAVRFSLAVSEKGTADTSRNVRGFSTKFYTRDGVFDLLCNHIPVFLVRDAIRFPESIKSFLPAPTTGLGDATRFWDFVARAPEATNFVTYLFSDRGTVKSLWHMSASSVNTYVWKNASDERFFVKYHWKPVAGESYIDADEATELAGTNPDIAGQDLYDGIKKNGSVDFELNVQIMHPSDVETLPYDPLDCTKVWDEEAYPLIPVGRMALSRAPESYVEQNEKLAFSPMNLLEGAEYSDDKMLQGRTYIYWDSQRHRLGNDFRTIPVNKQENWTPDNIVTSGLGREVEGELVRAEIPKQDDFAQAGERYNSLTREEKDHLIDNIAGGLALASGETQRIVLGYLGRASEELASRIQIKMQ